jgi:gluconate:H+ symporter, GntP family
MNASFLQVILFLIAGIASIILLTVRFKVHPFFALLIACFVTGLGVQLPFSEILTLVKNGFGETMSKLAIIIVLGTAIGVLLEKNGSTQVMANYILELAGTRRASLALSITGFIVGLPIFCDSGYIVLNGINKSITRKAGMSVAQMSISLASGLYAVHCLLPPHPGATAAAITLSVELGKLIGYGILIAIPAMLIGHWWAVYAGRKSSYDTGNRHEEPVNENVIKPSVPVSFLPVVIPILLMAAKSIIGFTNVANGWLKDCISLIGDPSVALAIGVVLALLAIKNRKELSHHLSASVEKAGSILVIIGAGGAFGAVLAATHIGDHFSNTLDLAMIGIWFPFLLTCIIKTAQGSSTVAIITASSIVLPLLPALGLDSANGHLLAVLSMGAGSMMLSHTNDAYFWVVSKFSDIGINTMLRVHTIASLLMGLTTMIIIYILSLIIL